MQSEAILRAFYDHSPFLMGTVELFEPDDVLHIHGNAASCYFYGAEPGATAQKLARAELGVEARSEGPGKGSEFIVRLPISAEPSPSGPDDSDRGAPGTRTSLRALIVDDNKDGADSLSMMLSLLGNDTRTAYDGEEAVEVAERFRPDVILLDIGLPKRNGYEVCRTIRAQPWGKDVTIIAQTGWGQAEDRQKTRDAGFDHHLIKPVDMPTLMNLLATVQPAAG